MWTCCLIMYWVLVQVVGSCLMLYIKNERQCFIRISKRTDKKVENTTDTQRSIFDGIRGFWITDETLNRNKTDLNFSVSWL